MAVIIECDRCKTTVRGKDAAYVLYNVGSKENLPTGSPTPVHGHLCVECATEVIRFIGRPPKDGHRG